MPFVREDQITTSSSLRGNTDVLEAKCTFENGQNELYLLRNLHQTLPMININNNDVGIIGS